MLKILLVAGICLISTLSVYAEEDEAALFGDTESIISFSNVQDKSLVSNMDKESVTFSGNISTSTFYGMHRDWLNGKVGSVSNNFLTYLQGNVFLDIRLTKGIKAFANINAFYGSPGQVVSTSLQQVSYSYGLTNVDRYLLLTPVVSSTNIVTLQTNSMILSLKEFFVDANWNKAVYMRGGKQVLQWGTCYLWNVSDMVNVQSKDFFNMAAYREGSYGLKMHIPVGTAANFYTWYDANNIQKPEKGAIVGKAEVLLGGTEVSLSAWAKQDFHPVYAADFTTRLLGIDFRGEVRLADWDSMWKVAAYDNTNVFPLGTTNFMVIEPITNQWTPKIVLGFTKQFDVFEKENAVTLIGEFLYNGAGYNYNVFADDAKRAALLNMPGAYIPNNTSMFYGALFMSYIDFIIPNLTFNMNAMMNLIDYSCVLSPGCSYNPVNNFTFGLTLNCYAGPENGEYTYSRQPLQLRFTTSMNF